MDFSARQADQHIATLDGWRAIAISLVLFSHGYPSLERMGLPALEARERIGLLGVQIFFALSGYLITTRLMSEEDGQGFASLPSFYVRRAFRILPAALMMILCVSVLSALETIPRISAGRVIDTILFLANYSTAEPSYYLGHFWSLAVEEHFYFIWPAIFVLFSSKRRLLTAFLLALTISCWRAINWKYQITGDTPDRFFARTDIMADSILWGVIVALASASSFCGPQLRAALSLRSIWISLLLFSIAASVISFGDWKTNFFLFSVCRISIALSIYATVINCDTAFGKMLDLRPVRFIGRISYSLYLWQELFLVVSGSSLASGWLGWLQNFPLNLFSALVCALLSYRLVEQPAMRLGRALSYGRLRFLAPSD